MGIVSTSTLILSILVATTARADDSTASLIRAISEKLSQGGKTNFQKERLNYEFVQSSPQTGKHFLDAEEGITAPEEDATDKNREINSLSGQP